MPFRAKMPDFHIFQRHNEKSVSITDKILMLKTEATQETI